MDFTPILGYAPIMTSKPAVRFLDRTTPPHISTLILLAGTGALSMNIFLPSLPAMAEALRADYRVVQLSVTLYLAMNAVLQLVFGPLSDRYGRRPVMLWSLAIFAVASVGCALSPTIEVFLTFRMMQAAVVAGLVLSRAVVRDMVPGAQAASMIGYVTMGMAVAPMLAPVVGGVLEQAFGWTASFWLLAVIGGAMIWLAWSDMGETAPKTNADFKSQFKEYPELLASRRFWGYAATAAFSTGAFFAYLGGAPFVGSEVLGLDPARLGLFFGAPALGYMAGNFLAGRYSVRIGINRMIVAGCIIAIFGLLLALVLNLAGVPGPLAFFGPTVFIGLGNGIALPNATAGMLAVRPHLAGTASGLGGVLMTGGGALLSSFAGWVLLAGGGALPLILLMLASALMALLSILLTIRREARVKAT